MQAPSDYSEMLSELSGAGVEFLVVGAFAVAHHSQPRFTKDIDIWVNPTPDNAVRVYRALARFGAPMEGITVDDFSQLPVVGSHLSVVHRLVSSQSSSGSAR